MTNPGARDPLGVLASTRAVVDAAEFVSIDRAKIEQMAEDLTAQRHDQPPDWDLDLHPVGQTDAETANLILVLDALNFCFWPDPRALRPRWRVNYQGSSYDGYLALASALRKAVERGIPLADPDYLESASFGQIARLLAGGPGASPVPLLDARVAHLWEVGRTLNRCWDGSFLKAIKAADRSAARLVREVIERLPSFDDVSEYRGQPVRFYKRAQILVADLAGAFGGRGPGRFDDLDVLTAFADYKVPQVLRQLGILRYEPSLAATIARLELIPPDDPREVEIRAATIWAVELLRQEATHRGLNLTTYELDWLLWQAGQSLPAASEPYHRTLTVFY